MIILGIDRCTANVDFHPCMLYCNTNKDNRDKYDLSNMDSYMVFLIISWGPA